MNLYIKAIGFEQVDSDFEEQMIHAGILDSLEKGLVIKNNELNRGAVIVRISESTGLYIYGRFKDKEFIYEYYFPFVIGRTRCDNDEITIERHLDKESYAVVCDESKTGVTLIFYLQNVMDYLDYICDEKGLNQKDYDIDSRSYVYKIPIKNKMVSLTALSLGGIIMLPTRNNKSDSVRMKKYRIQGEFYRVHSLLLGYAGELVGRVSGSGGAPAGRLPGVRRGDDLQPPECPHHRKPKLTAGGAPGASVYSDARSGKSRTGRRLLG